MNSLPLTGQIIAAAIGITLFFTCPSLAADQPNPLSRPDTPEPEVTVIPQAENVYAKDIMAFGVEQVLEKSRIGKRVDEIRQNLIKQYKFEYRKNFKPTPLSSAKGSSAQAPKVNAHEVPGIILSGRLNHRLAPEIEFKSRFEHLVLSSKLNVFGHRIDCDISSRPIEHFMDGRASLDFSSDGSRSQATIQLKFEF
jgi:hypothetical protein